MFVQPAKARRHAPFGRNSPGFAWISTPGSRTSSRFDAPVSGVVTQGEGILSTTRRATPDVSAAWSGAVESAGSNPHQEARQAADREREHDEQIARDTLAQNGIGNGIVDAKTLVDNREWVFRVLPHIHECRIPTEMIPSMPDGSPASLNLRVDDTFVEDFHWHQQARRYTDFVHRASQDNLLLLEFGIGYNTPGIIRLPFEQMAQRFPHTTLIRFNRDNPEPYIEDMPHFTAFTEDIATVINQL